MSVVEEAVNVTISKDKILELGREAVQELRREAEENGLQGMTEEEIEGEIRLARAERKR